MSSTKHFKLNNGISIPAVGLGCWMGIVGEGEHVTEMVKKALDVGYRHIDTASNYGTFNGGRKWVNFNDPSEGDEESVGKALQETTVPRNEIFLTTKLDQCDHGRVRDALDDSLKKLGVNYIDLYLMHWPMAYDRTGKTLQPDESPTYVETWKKMEELMEDDLVKAIGVSNFSVKTLGTLLNHAVIVPAVNQVELHPSLPQHELLAYCRDRGILLTAYSPIGKHKFADDPEIVDIARAHRASSAQVLLSWGVQRGTSVIPKTMREERMKGNLQLLQLSEAEMECLSRFHENTGAHRSVCGFHSESLGGSCFGWTYDQLGWDLVTGGVHI